MPTPSFPPTESRSLRRAGAWMILLFWAIQFVELTLVSAVEGWAYAVRVLPPCASISGPASIDRDPPS